MQAPALSEALPAELIHALEESVEGKELFDSLPLSRRREYVRQIAGAKKAKTRLFRARKFLMQLLERAI